jgi:hypothetical protein
MTRSLAIIGAVSWIGVLLIVALLPGEPTLRELIAKALERAL